MRIKEWLLDNEKRRLVICKIYRNVLKIQPFHSFVVRDYLNKYKHSDNIIYIWNQFDCFRAYYRLLLNQNTFQNKVKLVRVIHENTMFHNKPELRAIERVRKEKQYKQLKIEDQLYIEELLKYAIKDNNDQNRQRYPTLLHYLNDKNSESIYFKIQEFDQKYTPCLRNVECLKEEYKSAYDYLYDKSKQKQSIKRM